MRLTKLQKAAACTAAVLCAAVITSGIFIRQSYNRITTDPLAFDSAATADYAYYEEDTNALTESLTTGYINDKLKNADSVFICTVEDTANQYECLKHNIKIDRVIRGGSIQAGGRAVLYEYHTFCLDASGNLVFSASVTNNVPLQNGRQYLVFAEDMNYEQGYKDTLLCPEFRVFSAEVSTFCLGGDQTEPIDINVKTYGEIKDYEYICFSEKGLKTLNSIKRDIIDMYL